MDDGRLEQIQGDPDLPSDAREPSPSVSALRAAIDHWTGFRSPLKQAIWRWGEKNPGESKAAAAIAVNVAIEDLIRQTYAQGIVTGTDETRSGSVERSEIEPDGEADAPKDIRHD